MQEDCTTENKSTDIDSPEVSINRYLPIGVNIQ